MVALVCFRATCSRHLFIPQSVPNSSDCTFCAPGEGWWPSLFSKQGLTKARASGRQSPYHHRAVTRARVLITCCNRVMMVRVESVSLWRSTRVRLNTESRSRASRPLTSPLWAQLACHLRQNSNTPPCMRCQKSCLQLASISLPF